MDGSDPRASLSAEDYLRERVDEQLAWYDRKSGSHKRWYYTLQLVTLLAAAIVPIVSLSSGELAVRIVVAISGSVAALSAGVLSLYQFREQWVDYRATAETLKNERYRFLTGVEPYSGDDAFARLVLRVESIILAENHGWRSREFGTDADETIPRKSPPSEVDAESTGSSSRPDGEAPDESSPAADDAVARGGDDDLHERTPPAEVRPA